MRYFDCHSHFSTEAGLHHATREDYEQAQRVFKRKRTFQTEAEMADGFRSRNVRTILDIYRTWRFTDEDEIRRSHDYVIDFARKNPDVVYASAYQRRRAVGQMIGGGPEGGRRRARAPQARRQGGERGLRQVPGAGFGGQERRGDPQEDRKAEVISGSAG